MLIRREVRSEMLEEWSQDHILGTHSYTQSTFAVFAYSPLCGTCTLARRMIELALQIDEQICIVKNNMLYSPQLTQKWQIKSIPAIIIVEKQQVIHIRYHMQSVDELLIYLRKYTKGISYD
jgi:hypothetical protein